MLAEIDKKIAGLCINGKLQIYIQQFGFNDYFCIDLPKNKKDKKKDKNLKILNTIFVVEKKISDDMYIVSKAQSTYRHVYAYRMITIDRLLSLYASKHNRRFYIDLKNKDTFMIHLT